MRSDGPLLRSATDQDLSSLQRLEDECFGDRRFRNEHLEWILRTERALTLIEDGDGRLRGALMLLFDGKVCRVLSVAVSREARRRRLGTELMLAAEAAARERGCTMIRLEVSTDNVAAIELYRRLEYRVDGVLPGYYSWGADALAMHKEIAEGETP
ncbi:MAG: hypothetical protein A3K68_00515 [Euryarchaeota archaeon RBG_16_68_13]|nr:MAG: hypothetical protein A3K68_00515 [Euryarchaeota archaeon RBG_16_68_13]